MNLGEFNRRNSPKVPDYDELARILHRVLSPLLTWHGAYYNTFLIASQGQVLVETTQYRFPVIGSARASFEVVTGTDSLWQRETDQWLASSAAPDEIGDLEEGEAYDPPTKIDFVSASH